MTNPTHNDMALFSSFLGGELLPLLIAVVYNTPIVVPRLHLVLVAPDDHEEVGRDDPGEDAADDVHDNQGEDGLDDFEDVQDEADAGQDDPGHHEALVGLEGRRPLVSTNWVPNVEKQGPTRHRQCYQ